MAVTHPSATVDTSTVIARRRLAAVAIQKLPQLLRLLDCFGAEAPRNDEKLTAVGVTGNAPAEAVRGWWCLVRRGLA
ncbi:MAG: hypothetical protein ACLPX9_09915 [Rhodomicrobium sp.]